jgi:hypothetical protein
VCLRLAALCAKLFLGEKFWGVDKIKLKEGGIFLQLNNEMGYIFTVRRTAPWVEDILDSSLTSK